MDRVRYHLVHKDGQDHVVEIYRMHFEICCIDHEYSQPEVILSRIQNDLIQQWKETEKGKFIMEHAIKGSFEVFAALDPSIMRSRIRGSIKIEGKDLTKYYLIHGD